MSTTSIANGLIFEFDRRASILRCKIDNKDSISEIVLPTSSIATVNNSAGEWTLEGLKIDNSGRDKRALWDFHNTVVIRKGVELCLPVSRSLSGEIKIEAGNYYSANIKKYYTRMGVTLWIGSTTIKIT